MKLYVKDKNGKRLYLNKIASSKNELVRILGKHEFTTQNQKFSVNEVRAQKDSNDTFKGLIVGGVIGAIAGPTGIAIGSATGAILGSRFDNTRSKHVERFNNSIDYDTKFK